MRAPACDRMFPLKREKYFWLMLGSNNDRFASVRNARFDVPTSRCPKEREYIRELLRFSVGR